MASNVYVAVGIVRLPNLPSCMITWIQTFVSQRRDDFPTPHTRQSQLIGACLTDLKGTYEMPWNIHKFTIECYFTMHGHEHHRPLPFPYMLAHAPDQAVLTLSCEDVLYTLHSPVK